MTKPILSAAIALLFCFQIQGQTFFDKYDFRVPVTGERLIASEKAIVESPRPSDIFLFYPLLGHGFDGRIILTVDYSGPGTPFLDGVRSKEGDRDTGNQVRVYISDDNGQNWRETGARIPMTHQMFFKAGNRLYLMGNDHNLVICCSDDNGETWSETSVINDKEVWGEQGGTPVSVKNGKVTLVYDHMDAVWGWHYGPVLLQADENADLTKPESWRFSEMFNPDEDYETGRRLGIPRDGKGEIRILESNTLTASKFTPFYDDSDSTFVVLSRCNPGDRKDIAVILEGTMKPDGSLELGEISEDYFFVPLPGGHLKFFIVYDEVSQLYWMVHSQSNGLGNDRRRLALSYSPNLLQWNLAGIVAAAPESNSSRNYASMIISGDDLLIASRSGDKHALRAHDANLTTLHRVPEFRTLAVKPDCTETVAYSVAHRGLHIDGHVQENTLKGVEYAQKYHFPAIECDVKKTKDGVLVLMHDKTINRTMRLKEGYAPIPEPVECGKTKFKTLREKYVIACDDPDQRVPIPTLDEELQACIKYGITPMLHTKEPDAFRRAHEVMGDNFIAFNSDYESLKAVRKYSDCLILWDPGQTPAEEVVLKLKGIGGRCGISSMKWDMLTKEYVSTVRDAGFEVQASIFPVGHDIEAIANGCSIVLSDYCLYPSADDPKRREFYNMPSKFYSDLALKKGESLDIPLKLSPGRHICTEIKIECSGDAILSVCGVKYHLGKQEGVQTISMRHYYTQGKIKLTALEDTFLNQLEFNLFYFFKDKE